jgi:hydrogenase maturation protein HypF
LQKRIKISIKGAVQGVGFRPFIYKLANSLGLKGYVLNNPQGVIVEAEGDEETLTEFTERIKSEKPAISFIQNISTEELPLYNYKDFEIRKSNLGGSPNAIVLPDIATCKDCRDEIFDPNNRRYLYPFTNCTNCGPRYSIIDSLPYDRKRTSMKIFGMCPECKTEYDNPDDRRFHAQPNACPVCGPHLELWDSERNILSTHNVAVTETINAIRDGQIIALKGLGGFQLIVDALNSSAVKRLRKNKFREEKPFALMYPDIESVKNDCEVSSEEDKLLLSPQAPIVLLKRRPECSIPDSVAPLNPYLGIMLPYTPLHHIIMNSLKTPVVATSGNISDEPICIDENEALRKLKNIADLFLVHNRPINRQVDDSITRIVMNEKVTLRRARGYAPMPVIINSDTDEHILAVGGHLKNTVAVSKGDEVFVSQHIGDLENVEQYNSFCCTIDKFKELYKIEPDIIISDMHPDYISTKYAKENYKITETIQHHAAHILSVIAEHGLKGPLLGISWDGAGYGIDKIIWGSESLVFNETGFKRIGYIRKFRLPGGESSFKEIYKSAFGLLYEIYGDEALKYLDKSDKDNEKSLLLQMLKKSINSPECSSMGRLFDAVASILNVRQVVSFEGQAAMELEFLTDCYSSEEYYEYEILIESRVFIFDWASVIRQIIQDKENKVLINSISVKFHNTLVRVIVEIAKLVNENIVALSGGCFQNKYLLQNSIKELRKNGFDVYWNKEVPANDGGISLGQIAYFSYFKKIK